MFTTNPASILSRAGAIALALALLPSLAQAKDEREKYDQSQITNGQATGAVIFTAGLVAGKAIEIPLTKAAQEAVRLENGLKLQKSFYKNRGTTLTMEEVAKLKRLESELAIKNLTFNFSRAAMAGVVATASYGLWKYYNSTPTMDPFRSAAVVSESRFPQKQAPKEVGVEPEKSSNDQNQEGVVSKAQ
jgi:hypothetical protein